MDTQKYSNFSLKGLALGFKPVFNKKFNPNMGWFGVMPTHPFERLEKGNKSVHIGVFTTTTLFKSGIKEVNIEKIIKLCDGNNIIYSTLKGELPSNDIIDNFFKNV